MRMRFLLLTISWFLLQGLNLCYAQSTLFDAELSRYRRYLLEPEDLVEDIPQNRMFSEYDFVVVGAGVGGATVTSRLSEVPEWRVLLLEAGGDEIAITDIPLIVNHFKLTDYNWGYSAQPQPNACLGMTRGRCNLPRGKGMGGSSIINYMMYIRGHAKDYDDWEAMGNNGWGWSSVLPYFIKSENARGDFARNSPYHGKGGLLDIQNVPWRSPLLMQFIKGAKELGYPILDYNSGYNMGFSEMQAFLRNGSRCSSSKAFLRPVRHRKNLHVAKYAHVTRILIDPVTKRAYGVEYQRDGRRWMVRARKEVILSAGAMNTPHLLMLSGIGPRDHLNQVGVPVVHNLPGVGRNLQDHPSMPGLAFLVNVTEVSLVEDRLLSDVGAFFNYVVNGRGPLTSIGTVEGVGFIRTKIAKTAADHPDMEFMFAAGSLASDDGRVVRKGVGLRDDIYNAIYKPIHGRDTWTIWPMLLQPESRGWIRLKNKNPFSWPLIYENYFESEHDLNVLVEGIKFVIEMSRTSGFQSFDSHLHDIPVPGCEKHTFGSDAYWRCTAQVLTASIHHHCCTAKMGPVTDNMAVVDPELRVYGVSGLRVADVSIMPKIPAGHTAAPTFMIGEKAADLIKATYGKLNRVSQSNIVRRQN